MGKAWLAATAVMTASLVVLYASLPYVSNAAWLFLGWAIPVLGAAAASYLAPRSKFKVGASTVLLALLILGLGGYVAGELGYGDAIGITGEVFVMALYAPVIALASALGALIGEWASKERAIA